MSSSAGVLSWFGPEPGGLDRPGDWEGEWPGLAARRAWPGVGGGVCGVAASVAGGVVGAGVAGLLAHRDGGQGDRAPAWTAALWGAVVVHGDRSCAVEEWSGEGAESGGLPSRGIKFGEVISWFPGDAVDPALAVGVCGSGGEPPVGEPDLEANAGDRASVGVEDLDADPCGIRGVCVLWREGLCGGGAVLALAGLLLGGLLPRCRRGRRCRPRWRRRALRARRDRSVCRSAFASQSDQCPLGALAQFRAWYSRTAFWPSGETSLFWMTDEATCSKATSSL